MANEVDNSEDIIDSRDVIARIAELESDIESWEGDIEEHQNEIIDLESEIISKELESSELDDDIDAFELEELEDNIENLQSDIDSIEDNISTIRNDITEAEEELTPLTELASYAENYAGDWQYGEALIRDSYFTEYAKQLVTDIGDLPFNLPGYIENNIDWSGVADDIQMDYTSVDFDGVEYWIR